MVWVFWVFQICAVPAIGIKIEIGRVARQRPSARIHYRRYPVIVNGNQAHTYASFPPSYEQGGRLDYFSFYNCKLFSFFSFFCFSALSRVQKNVTILS